jgi:DNA-binding IclR family transcriptional regulator
MIKSVAKAIDILQLFTSSEPRFSLSEISRRLNLPKSTAHNLLGTLASHGFIERVDGNLYALGTAIISLTQSVRVNVELRDRAAPLLRELADQSRESVYLTVLDSDRALYIYAIESPHRLLARTAVGERAMLHCTSVGKAILSALPEQAVKDIVGRIGLSAFTPATITDLDVLLTDLAETRARGYAVDTGEHETGIYCVGAPVLDTSGHVIGACSVSGTDREIVTVRQEELGVLVVKVAQEISRRMGYVPARPSVLVGTPLSRAEEVARRSPPQTSEA